MTTTASLSELHAIEKMREQELSEARALQSSMLPGNALRTDEVRIAYEFQPFTEVGGDFLDYFTLTDGTVGLYLGDVTGKGLPAAMYAALAVGTLRGVHKSGTAAAAVLAQFNKRLMIRGMSIRYSAVQYMVLDPRTGRAQIASAGMPGPLLLSGSGCQDFQLSGIPPGLFAAAEYDGMELQMVAGDSLLFVSDGITDAMDASEEVFGLERLAEVCRRVRGATPEETLGEVFAAVEKYCGGHCQQDDRTAAVLQFTG